MGFALLLFLLPSFKNVGAMYAGIVFTASFILFLAGKKKAIGFIRALICLLFAAVSYFSWQLIIHTKGTGEFIDFQIAALSWGKILNVAKGITIWGKIPFLWIALFFLAADLLLTFCLKDIKKQKAFLSIAAFFCLCVFFFYGYTSHYGWMLSSIHRYTQTFIFAMFVYLFMRIVSFLSQRKEAKKKRFAGRDYLLFTGELVLLAASVFVLLGFREQKYPNPYFSDIRISVEAFDKELSEDAALSFAAPAKCYLAIGGDTREMSQQHETFHYLAVGTRVSIKNIWCDKIFDESVAGVVTDEKEAAGLWAENLSKGDYRFVLIKSPDEQIKAAVRLIAGEINLQDQMILKVIPSDGEYPVTFAVFSESKTER